MHVWKIQVKQNKILISQLQNNKNLPLTTKTPIHMYSPFLWRIAKGQSLIIKRRWLRWSSKTLQIRSQRPKLIKHVHQKLTMSCLNNHDSLQHTTNVRVIWSKRWRKSSSNQINVSICSRITWSSGGGGGGGGGGGATPEEEESTLGYLELARI